MVILADNQREAARRLAGAGAVALLGEARDILTKGLKSALVRFVDDRTLQRRISEAAAGITDGRGTARVLDTMQVVT